MIRYWTALFFLTTSISLGDSIRPAYLEIIETAPGSIDVIWKMPKIPGLPPHLEPALPSSFHPSSAIENMDTPDATVRKWSMIGTPLAGQAVHIAGLENGTMEALLRVELADGTTVRKVLKPSAPGLDLPAGGRAEGESFLSHALYPLLFLAAFGLSLTPPARKQGILLCALALIAGSLAGHAIGSRAPNNGRRLSDAETRRILQGLMLNTYRAFIFEDDETVYDVLALSVEGEALNDIFLENRSRLSFNDPEAAASLVDRLDIKAIEAMKAHRDGSYTLLTDWDVYGSVFHWEHVHFRCNAFKAEITIVPVADYWKITRLAVLEEERIL